MSDMTMPNQALSWLGTTYFITLGHSDSDGRIGAFESKVPGGGGPPMHVHHREDEVIHVLAEPYEFWIDGETRILQPGESIFLPRGIPHCFRVASDGPGRNLTLFTPAGLEGFFVEAAARRLVVPADMPSIAELGGRYGLEFLGPPNWRD